MFSFLGGPTQHFWRKKLVSNLHNFFRLPKFWHRASLLRSQIAHYSNSPHQTQWPQFAHRAQCGSLYTWESHIFSTLGHGGGIFWCPNVGWFCFKVSPHYGPQLHHPTFWAVLLKSRQICDHEVISQVQWCCSQLNQYHEPHLPIATRTDRHIPHTTMPWDKPASKSRRFATVCELWSLGWGL